MEWSPQQDAALVQAGTWLQEGGQQVFRIFGYAGTGKTTLARHLAEGVSGRTLFGAYTGKAAMMMRKNGAHDATTIHSMIYKFEQDPESGTFKSRLDFSGPAARAKLIVIDECSMVDEKIGNDLLSFGKPILVLGDPAQLPPIRGGGFFTSHEPDVMLTEIHRQAEDNPIVMLASQIRQGGAIKLGRYGDSKVIAVSDLSQYDVTESDQVLVGTNKTRQDYNHRLRELNDFESRLPVAGDRLVCLKNDHGNGLANGSMWRVHEVLSKITGSIEDGCIRMVIVSEDFPDTEGVNVIVREEFFTGGAEEIPWQELRGTQQFTFGYALTVHKSQGSQWGNVCLFDQSGAFREHQARWLYTGITRAADKVTVVR